MWWYIPPQFDHFPGCQRKTLEQLVAGAPNFRSVVIDGVTLHVHGTAVPTKDGASPSHAR